MSQDYRGQDSVYGEEQECRGSAVFRANVGYQVATGLLQVEPDHDAVFSTNAEFLSHHSDMGVKQADEFLAGVTPHFLFVVEMLRANCKES
jgi:hypothetical protein